MGRQLTERQGGEHGDKLQMHRAMTGPLPSLNLQIVGKILLGIVAIFVQVQYGIFCMQWQGLLLRLAIGIGWGETREVVPYAEVEVEGWAHW